MGTRGATLSKISIPIIGESHILPRKRLFRLLDKGLKKPFIWVAGPPGAGKTTLIANYLTTVNLPHLWYQMDRGDADLSTFFHYLSLAAKSEAGRGKRSYPVLTPEYQDVSAFARRYFEEFYGGLSKDPFVIVFDNHQEVPADSPFHRTIYEGLIKIPEGIHVIFISHTEPISVFARLRAHNLMEVIGWDVLRLTLEETRKITGHHWKRPSKEEIDYLHNKTDGWIAGLKIVLAQEKTDNRIPASEKAAGPDTVSAYFTEEILRNSDDETRKLLLKTAFLPQISVRIAIQLSGIEKAGRILENLHRRNYFTTRYSSHGVSYRYHPLFGEFLRQEATRQHGREECRQTLIRAAELLQEGGHEEMGVDLFLDGGAYDRAAALICRCAPELFFQGRSGSIREWLNRLPKEVFAGNPFLCQINGECLMALDPGQSRDQFKRAFTLFRNMGNKEGMMLASSAVIETYLHEWDCFVHLDDWIGILVNLAAGAPSFSSQSVEARVTTAIFQALIYRKPEHPELPVWCGRVESLLEQDISPSQRLMMGYLLMLYYSFIGDYRKMSALRHAQQSLLESPEISPLIKITSFCLHAVCELLTAPTENIYRLVARGKASADKLGVHLLDGKLFAQGAYAACSIGAIERAGQYIDSMAACTGQRRLEVVQYQHLKSFECLLRGDPSASAHAEKALALAIEAGSPFHEGLCRFRFAQILIKTGNFGKAEDHLRQVHAICSGMGSKNLEFQYLLYKAQLCNARGDARSCEDFLRKAMALGREQWYMNYDGWESSVMSDLCVKALEAGIEVEYVQELVRKRGLIPEVPPLHLKNWPWALKMNTLGRFELIRDGKPVHFKGKVQKKPIEMLKALIAFGCRDVSEERIVDALWPEALGDAARSAFSTTLQRLRQLIGNDKVLHLRDGRLSLDFRLCWVDAWTFEQALLEGDNVSKIGQAGEEVRFFEEAFALYRGDFMAGDEKYSWTISPRERLRGKFIRLVSRIGKHWENRGSHDMAAEYYLRGLEVDNLAEEFYQHLMTCYQRQGRRAEALAVYCRCRETLASTFGVAPSTQTESIYRKLQQS